MDCEVKNWRSKDCVTEEEKWIVRLFLEKERTCDGREQTFKKQILFFIILLTFHQKANKVN